MFCPECGKELSNDAAFCGNCGAKVANSQINAATAPQAENFNGYAAPKAKSSEAIIKIDKKIIAIVIAIIAILAVAFNLHTCEECEKVYLGEEKVISFFGASAKVCKDCYEDFYSW